MRMQYSIRYGFACWWCLLASAAAAAEPKRADELVELLGASTYHERQAAFEALESMGAAARPALEAASQHPDPEIRLRVRGLLSRQVEEDLWRESRVTLAVEGKDLENVLMQIASETGSSLILEKEFAADEALPPVSLTCQQWRFWEVIGSLCEQTGTHVQSVYDGSSQRLGVVKGVRKYPEVLVGPFRLCGATARRYFSEELEIGTDRRDIVHSFHLALRLVWEPRFRLAAYRGPKVLEAVTDSGMALHSVTTPPLDWWGVVNRETCAVSASVSLLPPPTSAARLSRLRLAWEMIAVGDFGEIEVPPYVSGTYAQEEILELEVRRMDVQKDGTYVVSATVRSELPAPETASILLYENDFQLLDASGTPFGIKEAEAQIHDGAVRMSYTFVPKTPGQSPQSLRLRYPRLRSCRTVEFLLRDFPLPQARP